MRIRDQCFDAHLPNTVPSFLTRNLAKFQGIGLVSPLAACSTGPMQVMLICLHSQKRLCQQNSICPACYLKRPNITSDELVPVLALRYRTATFTLMHVCVLARTFCTAMIVSSRFKNHVKASMAAGMPDIDVIQLKKVIKIFAPPSGNCTLDMLWAH